MRPAISTVQPSWAGPVTGSCLRFREVQSLLSTPSRAVTTGPGPSPVSSEIRLTISMAPHPSAGKVRKEWCSNLLRDGAFLMRNAGEVAETIARDIVQVQLKDSKEDLHHLVDYGRIVDFQSNRRPGQKPRL